MSLSNTINVYVLSLGTQFPLTTAIPMWLERPLIGLGGVSGGDR